MQKGIFGIKMPENIFPISVEHAGENFHCFLTFPALSIHLCVGEINDKGGSFMQSAADLNRSIMFFQNAFY